MGFFSLIMAISSFFVETPSYTPKQTIDIVNSNPDESHIIIKDYALGAFIESDLNLAMDFLSNKDSTAFNKLMIEGRIFALVKNKKVFIVENHISTNNVKIRYEGATESFWTKYQVLK